MKTKTGWLIVILISSVQLALLLIAVMSLFSWFGNWAESSVAVQACSDNQVIGRQVSSSIANTGLNAEQARQPEGLEQLRDLLTNMPMPNYGFVSLLDANTGEALASYPAYPNLEGDLLAQAPFFNDQLKGVSVVEAARTSTDLKGGRQGVIGFGQHEHFASLESVPQLDALLVVAQQRNPQFFSGIMSARSVVFATTLLVGLACMSMIVAILNRMNAQFDDQSQSLENEVSLREKQIVRTQNAVIFGLAKLAESRDNDTGEHLDRIRSYVLILSKDLNGRLREVDDEFVQNIALASSLHDVGKVGIPDSILLKPGRLTKEEREVMELHTLIGGECLEAIQNRLGDHSMFMRIAKQIAYYHHERWDGAGYPFGLRGSDIPLVARIVAVADVYDALTSKRPYKQPLSHLESKGIILAGTGTQFDPEVVDAFLRHEHEFEAISRSQQKLTDDDVRSEFHVLCERAQKTAQQDPVEA